MSVEEPMTHWKPDGYPCVAPYLMVDGAERTIDFLRSAFAAELIRRFPDRGPVMHAEVRIADTVVMLADASEEWPALPAYVHVYVPDVDATYDAAMAAGAESVQKPVKKEDADKRAGVKDAGGTTWWIATKVDS